jgi:hypothetical protein
MPEIVWILLVPLGWIAAAMAFRRARRGTQGYAERNALRSRLPAWVATAESVVLVLLWVTSSLGVLFVFVQLHVALHPRVRAKDVGQLAMILIVTGSFVATLVPSMLVANLVSWLVPPLRTANESAMVGLPTTTFANASRGVAVLGAFVVPLALAQGLLGAVEPWV